MSAAHAKLEGGILVGRLEEIPFGKFRMIEVDGWRVGITRLPDGEVRAIRDFCPHKAAAICRGVLGGTWLPSEPGELRYGRKGEVLACPWHGFEFDLRTGEGLYQEKPTRLMMLRVTVEKDEVFVHPRTRHRAA